MLRFPVCSRLLVVSCLSSGLALSVGCDSEDPFKEMRESEDKEEEKETGTGGEGGTKAGGGQDANNNNEGSGGDNNRPGGNDATTTGGNGAGNGGTGDGAGESGSTGGQGGGDTQGGGGQDQTGGEPGVNPMCKKLPGRLIVLGDFTPAGRDPINGPDDANNGFKIVHEHLKSAYKLNSLTYQNVAVAASEFKAMGDSQIANVETGPASPVMVLIHSGSNDLAAFIQKEDHEAETAFNPKWTEAEASLDKVVAHFNDKSKYPGGATILINTLYNPFDDCQQEVHTSGLIPKAIGVSVEKTALMARFNQNIRDYANKHANLKLVDLHPVFLGHGLNYDETECKNYKAGADSWMKGGSFTALQLLTDKSPLTDLNVVGHGKVGEVINRKIDALFDGC